MFDRVMERPAVTVTHRECLFAGGAIVEMAPSTHPQKGTFVNEAGVVEEYYSFNQNVRGGMVIFHIRAPVAEPVKSQKIRADARVMKKDLADGRSYLYIDLFPSDNEVTHRLVVSDATAVPEEMIVFRTPEPLRGMVVLMAPDAKMPAPMITSILDRSDMHKKPADSCQPDSDPQLTRLLADGWIQESSNSTQVILYKIGKGGKIRTMTHHKPKRKWCLFDIVALQRFSGKAIFYHNKKIQYFTFDRS